MVKKRTACVKMTAAMTMTTRRKLVRATVLAVLLPCGGAWAQPTDEPGMSGTPPASLPASAPVDVGADVVARARAECQPGTGAICPHFAELVRQLYLPGHGAEAARLLGELGDPRAVAPLSQLAVYGAEPELRLVALAALRSLVAQREARAAAVRLGTADADPAIRKAVAEALGGEATLRRKAAAPAATELAELEGQAKADGLTDPDAARVVYGSTAFGRPRGTWNWTIYNIAYWSFDYGINDHLEVGMQTVPPIGVVAFMPHVKLTTPVGEKVALGLRLTGGVFYPYIANEHDWRIGIYGGGPVLTIGSRDLLLNLAVQIYGVTIAETVTEPGRWTPTGLTYSEITEYDNSWAITPSAGFSWRVSRRLKINAELYPVLLQDNPVENGKLWVLLYGLRIFGERIYGDLNFVIPFFPEMGEIIKYVPVGFPLLTFGFQW